MEYSKFLLPDENNREIGFYNINNAVLSSFGFYPNISFTNCIDTYYPISDRVMSLNGIELELKTINYTPTKTESNPVFLFTYNVENYYHFVYDTIPYLISYFELKKSIPSLKLLMQYPYNKKKHYAFVEEFLEILDIHKKDILILDKNTKYSSLFWSDSFTHGHDSNLPPRKEIYQFYRHISNLVQDKYHLKEEFDKIYISRRTHIHGKLDNLGTNYTDRRCMVNEDEVVKYLTSIGYTEVFTELMPTANKIALFSNVKKVVGAIGGGLVNVLFSNNCETIPIISPYFLDINYRFLHSLNQTKLNLFYDTCHTEKNEYKLYMRVKFGTMVGEISEVHEDSLKVKYSQNPIAGWSNDIKYEEAIVKKCDCVRLDNGLNSPWKVDQDKLRKFILD